ncbi:hypothetical protein E5676_scaffold83490G00020 [Cucumis melo var. makuwa]|uniref:Uncharacterized protein n=1 Tax=Cucumis melo var. makuwa TaxID=1194695 RepID=A0A5D3DPS1_CUCMM|nr:hypothetical protein E5676_scaffold83490G00020 [Cucumis melo var. makuwa]
MHERLSSFHLSLSPFSGSSRIVESESIVIGLTAQGLSEDSPFWSPVIGRKPFNSISILGILLSIGYIYNASSSFLSRARKGMRKCSSSRQAGSKGKRIGRG